VNFYPRQIETAVLRHPGVSHEYQIVIDTDGGGERLVVLVEAEPGCDPSVAARIRQELRDAVSISPDVTLCAPGTIERPQGKAVRVVDRRPR
jgi:phenylacetate-CoA ligase